MDKKNRKKTSIVIDPQLIQRIPRSITISEAIEAALRLWLDAANAAADKSIQPIEFLTHKTEHSLLDQILDYGGEPARAVKTMLRALAGAIQSSATGSKQTKSG